MRLLRLPQEVRANVASNALSMGHARALLALADEAAQLRLGRDIVARGLSVRETEALVKKSARQPGRDAKPEDTKADVQHPRRGGQTPLSPSARASGSTRRGKGGRIEIDFVNEDELQRLYEYLTGTGG